MMNPLCVNINNTFSWKIIIFYEANFKKGNECRCFTFLHISLMFDLIEDSWILIWAYAIVLLRHIASFFFYLKYVLLLLSCLNCVQFLATLWTVAHQTPLSMGFSWQEYWSGLPFPPSGDLPNLGIEPMSPALAGGFFTTAPSGKYVMSILPQ